MGKKVAFLLILFFMLVGNLKSQVTITNKISWQFNQAQPLPVFESREDLVRFGKSQLPFSSVTVKDFNIQEFNFLIIIVSGCSGLPCYNISVYNERNKKWRYVAGTSMARFNDSVMVNKDDLNKRFLFKVREEMVGELYYDTLFSYSNYCQ
jgi:hypothetical protein